MNLQKRLTVSLLFALVIFALSFFMNLVPCQTAPRVPNPIYAWTTCNINPDSTLIGTAGIQRLYFGYTTSLTTAYLLVLIISFLLPLMLLHFIARKKK